MRALAPPANSMRDQHTLGRAIPTRATKAACVARPMLASPIQVLAPIALTNRHACMPQLSLGFDPVFYFVAFSRI